MGVTSATAEFLVEAASRGVDFSRTVTVGRQALFLGPRTARRILRRHGFDTAPFDATFTRTPGIADPLWYALGAHEVLALDASDYEGADVIHDLNQPLPEDLQGRFTARLRRRHARARLRCPGGAAQLHGARRTRRPA